MEAFLVFLLLVHFVITAHDCIRPITECVWAWVRKLPVDKKTCLQLTGYHLSCEDRSCRVNSNIGEGITGADYYGALNHTLRHESVQMC